MDALLTKARRGDIDAVLEALMHDPGLLRAKSLGHNRTLLWESVRGNQPALVNHMLGKGADPDIPGRNRSEIPVLLPPYCIAVRYGREELGRLLLEIGAEIDLFAACYLGDLDKVRGFLDSDEEALTKEQRADSVWRVTPLHHAVAGGHEPVVRLLLERGAPVLQYTRLLCDVAKRCDHLELVDLLLEHGADPELAKEWSGR